MNSISRIQGTPQTIAVNGTSASPPTTSVAPRALSRLATGDVLTAASSATGGAALGNLLPSTTEEAVSSATDNSQQATLMGQTVGASLAETGDTINWRDFASEAKSSLSAAGYSDSEIKVYLGAVKQTYQQFQALPVSTVTATSTAAAAVSTSTSAPDVSSDPSTYDPENYDPDTSNYTPSTSVASGTPAASTPTLIIDPSQLPSVDLPASSFASLAQLAYQNAWNTAGSGVDIDELVANTQTEMDNMGYSQDQVDNYMIGLFQGYNVVNQTTIPVGTAPAADTPDTSGTDAPETPYNPNPPYDPLLDGDQGY